MEKPMHKIKFDFDQSMIKGHEYDFLKPMITAAHNSLHGGKGAGNDYIGWLTYPTDFDKVEFERIKTAAIKINEMADVLIVIGIGGSYLGAKTVIEIGRAHV